MADVTHEELANAIRALAMDAVQKANSGHPGMPMGMADVATVLFSRFLKYNPSDPDWFDRDRFILSAGHGSMLLYSLLYLTGYDDVDLEQIKSFRQLGAKTAGHPEYGHAKGIETTTGPLGQGIANAVGFALAEMLMRQRFGKDVVDHHTYAIVGDGCLMEGISQEAISFAGHLGLGKLIVLFDDNGISIDGSTDLTTSEDHLQRFKACGWDVQAIDGHDPDAIAAAIECAKASDVPSLIACKTTIAFGAPTKAGTSASHGAPLGDEEIAGTKEVLNWAHGPFDIPDTILSSWRQLAKNQAGDYDAWQSRHEALSPDSRQLFDRVVSGAFDTSFDASVLAYKEQLTKDQPVWATRKSSGEILDMLSDALPELIGGSADLTGSNLTRAKSMAPVAKEQDGRYVFYGIREHAMGAIMNGLALHGGLIPYGGTFLVFADYCRPAMRLSALMGQRVVYVMTHDSIGLGEDGPTHQPVEHLASLRAIPNMYVFRPADPVETLESWQCALNNDKAPSTLALTRQSVPFVRQAFTAENLTSRGAYVLSPEQGEHRVTIMASGSEVKLALEAKTTLERDHCIGVRVVSVPCLDLFHEQDVSYQEEVIGSPHVRVAVEAALRMGWDRFLNASDIFVGMDSFGASAPADELYKHFGITSDAIQDNILRALEN